MTELRDLPCDEVRRAIHDLLDGETPTVEVRRGLDAHLAGCESCRSAQDELQALRDLLGAAPPIPFPADALREVRRRTVDAKSRDEERPRRLDWRPLAAAAILAFAVWGLWPTGPATIDGYTEAELSRAAAETRQALRMAGRALRRTERAAVRDVLAGEVSPALRSMPIEFPVGSAPKRGRSGI